MNEELWGHTFSRILTYWLMCWGKQGLSKYYHKEKVLKVGLISLGLKNHSWPQKIACISNFTLYTSGILFLYQRFDHQLAIQISHNIHIYSGPCDERPPLLRSPGGLSWGCGLILGCKIYKKYHLVWTRGGHIRQDSLTTGGLSSQGPL